MMPAMSRDPTPTTEGAVEAGGWRRRRARRWARRSEILNPVVATSAWHVTRRP